MQRRTLMKTLAAEILPTFPVAYAPACFDINAYQSFTIGL